MATKKTVQAPIETKSAPSKVEGKFLDGVVVKTAMKDTATVSVNRYVKHPKYKKFMLQSKKFLVHDPGNTLVVGDKVTIRETRPISRHKRFIVAPAEGAASGGSK